MYLVAREKPFDLDEVRTRGDGALCAEDTDMPCFGIVSDDLGGGPDNAEDTAGAINKREILALDGAKCFGGGGIAG